MVIFVLHELWLHGRYYGDLTCRQVIHKPFAGNATPYTSARDNERQRFDEFLATPEADETIRVVLERYGSKAER